MNYVLIIFFITVGRVDHITFSTKLACEEAKNLMENKMHTLPYYLSTHSRPIIMCTAENLR